MNVASKGSIMLKTVAEVRTILEKVLSIRESLMIHQNQLISLKRSSKFIPY
jgi:hypothetical protein